jgi:hypothetical protein
MSMKYGARKIMYSVSEFYTDAAVGPLKLTKYGGMSNVYKNTF